MCLYCSLSKSETKLKTNKGRGKSADSKKAKRRVKDVQKVLSDVASPDGDIDVSGLFASQIVSLCQRLMQVSGKLKTARQTPAYTIDTKIDGKSDSDSEDASSSSRATTPHHIYAEIKTLDDAYLTPKKWNSADLLVVNGKGNHMFTATNEVTAPSLKGVQLFSSDSDSPEDRTNTLARKSRGRSPRRKIISFHRKRTSSLSHENTLIGAHKSKSTHEFASLDNKDRPRYRSTSQPILQSRTLSQDVLNTQTFDSLFHPRVNSQWTDKTCTQRLEHSQRHIEQSCFNSNHNLDDLNFHEEIPQSSARSTSQQNNFTRSNRVVQDGDYKPRMDNSETNHESNKGKIVKPEQPGYLPQSLSPTKPLELRHWSNVSPLSARSAQKRVLPSLPRSCDTHRDIVQSEDRSRGLSNRHTITPKMERNRSDVQHSSKPPSRSGELSSSKYRDNQQSFFTWLKGQDGNVKKPDSDMLDEDELKFRESVRTAKADIIDKLKRKPYTNTSGENEILQSDQVPSYKDFENKIDARSSPCAVQMGNLYANSISEIRWGGRSNIMHHDTRTDNSNAGSLKTQRVAPFMHSYQNSETTYRSTIRHADTNSVTSSTTDADSIVASNIKKFESEIWKSKDSRSTNSRSRRALSAKGQTYGSRYRSSSEPRVQTAPVSVLPRRKHEFSKMPKEHQPRNEYKRRTSNGDQNQMPLESLHSQCHMRKSSTENDLHSLVKTQSSSSIRQWSLRRSNSFMSKHIERKSTNIPVYKYMHTISFSLPERMKRCHISAMAVLENDFVVILDERNFYLHLFDVTFQHVFERKLYDIPRGCEHVSSNDVFVALPYKRTLHHYSIVNASINLVKEISLNCNAWILDISFANNYLNVLCKGGHVHRMQPDGTEVNCISVCTIGRLFCQPSRKRMYVLGEGRLSKFDMEGNPITSHPDIDAHSILFLENQTYVADRQKHRIVPLTDGIDVQELTADKIEYPSASCTSINGDKLLVSQYEECLDDATTRNIRVYQSTKR